MAHWIFATHNPHKAREIAEMLTGVHEVSSLADLDCHEPIPETGATLEENAQIKADWVWERFGKPVFADDTGLEVDALGGAPGVHSARYAGEPADDARNRARLLEALGEVPAEGRRARFRTVICLRDASGAHFVEGVCTGSIAREPRGTGGFGYDSIFIPDDAEAAGVTFAQLSSEEKNAISHRGRAIRNLVARFLSESGGSSGQPLP
jgi:XTP/dITP diphosphohydrolase